jgi:hypothetical protein
MISCPYEQSEWAPQDAAQRRRWCEILDSLGPENVRATLAQNTAGSRAAIPIGAETNMTKGFAQAWLAWQDREKSKRENTFRADQIFWTRWAVLAASVAAIAAAVGWGFSILQK